MVGIQSHRALLDRVADICAFCPNHAKTSLEASMPRGWSVALMLCFTLAPWCGAGAQDQPDPPFRLNPRLYNPFADAKTEIADAVKQARQDHKRILLVFGGNWCLDCHVLDYRFHQSAIRPL